MGKDAPHRHDLRPRAPSAFPGAQLAEESTASRSAGAGPDSPRSRSPVGPLAASAVSSRGGPSRGAQESAPRDKLSPTGLPPWGTGDASIPDGCVGVCGASSKQPLTWGIRHRLRAGLVDPRIAPARTTASKLPSPPGGRQFDEGAEPWAQTSSPSDQSDVAAAPNSRHDDQGGTGTARAPLSAHCTIDCVDRRLRVPTPDLTSALTTPEPCLTHTPCRHPAQPTEHTGERP